MVVACRSSRTGIGCGIGSAIVGDGSSSRRNEVTRSRPIRILESITRILGNRFNMALSRDGAEVDIRSGGQTTVAHAVVANEDVRKGIRQWSFCCLILLD